LKPNPSEPLYVHNQSRMAAASSTSKFFHTLCRGAVTGMGEVSAHCRGIECLDAKLSWRLLFRDGPCDVGAKSRNPATTVNAPNIASLRVLNFDGGPPGVNAWTGLSLVGSTDMVESQKTAAVPCFIMCCVISITWTYISSIDDQPN
jgi:hypothetical protein